MATPFAREWLGRPRPPSLFGPGGVSLPRRVSYHPSPVDWRDEVLYFLLVDRFSDGREASRPLLDRTHRGDHRPAGWRWDAWAKSGSDRWQGGTLSGLIGKLDYLAGLGVSTLWLSPVFRQRGHLDTYHGYGVQDFLDVDPRFGTRGDLVDLVERAHGSGMRILLDIIFKLTENLAFVNNVAPIHIKPADHPYHRTCQLDQLLRLYHAFELRIRVGYRGLGANIPRN